VVVGGINALDEALKAMTSAEGVIVVGTLAVAGWKAKR
jgi:hypothetical protein